MLLNRVPDFAGEITDHARISTKAIAVAGRRGALMRRKARRVLAAMGLSGLLAVSCGIEPATAALFDDSATGNWNASNANTWGAGLNAFPQAGDHIIKNSGGVVITVTQNFAFGDGTGANLSTWGNGGNNGSIVIDPGVTLTHVAGSFIDQSGASMIFSGTGTFTNQGTVLLDGDAGNRPIQFNGGLQVINNGSFIADGGKPQVNINGATGLFTNNGTVSAQQGGGDFVFQGAGTFHNAATGIVENNLTGASSLVFSGASVSSAGGQWNAAAGRIIFIRDSLISGTFNGNGSGEVRLDDISIAGQGDVILNISNGVDKGASFRTNDGSLNLGNVGDRLVNQGIFVIGGGSNGTRNLNGDGIFLNNGTVINDSDGMHIGVGEGVLANSIDNNGRWLLRNKGGIDLRDADAQFRMNNDGILESTSINSPVSIKGAGRLISNGGQFIISGGDEGMSLVSTGTDAVGMGNIIKAHAGGPTFSVIAGETILVAGFYTELSGEAVGDGIVRLGNTDVGNGVPQQFSAAGSSVTVNVTGNGVRWYNLNVDFGGDELVNDGRITYNSDRRSFSNGTLTNNGVFEHLTTAFGGQEFEVLNATFSNNGLHTFPSNGKVEINGTGLYDNNAAGLILSDNIVNADTVQFFGTGTFNNEGTVEVRQKTLQFTTSLNMTQFETTPGTLTGGTWRVRDLDGAGGNAPNLDIQGVSNITTIGSGATVELAGPDATFARINSLTTVQGTFIVNDRTFNVAGGTLTLDGGTLAGTGTISGNVIGVGTFSPGNSPGGLTIVGNTLWAGGSSLLFEIGDPTGTDPVLDAGTAWDLLQVDGTLNIAATSLLQFTIDVAALDILATGQSWAAMIVEADAINGFDASAFAFNDLDSAFTGSFSISQQQNRLFLNYTVRQTGDTQVPEPASAGLLLLAGAVGLGRRRRDQSIGIA